MSNFNIAVCQMLVGEDKNKNLEKAEKMIRRAVLEKNAKVIVLPEMFNCPYDNSYFPQFAEEVPGPTTEMLSKIAKELKVYIVGGSIPEQSGSEIYNTSFIFNDEGEIVGRHRKIHLFDIDIEGGIVFKESDTLGRGDEITVVDTPMGKIGVAICYDIRFPELIRLMALNEAKIIIIPAAFNTTTGPAHWNELIKVRAFDNQVYLVAASPARDLEASYHAYGYSSIIDPWGKIIDQCSEVEAIISGEIDMDYLNKVRKELPLLKHRRTDLYHLDLR
ncbi:carbon-nitrogen hydrolase family protein [Alkaliphilus peptidifermentans]|uniref:Predicted amidohydrolase n=1 Tax=Alkaliphilus peptidifermentans DSM 18978 TaxID=1120976 RepID=A0A1G5CH61_9FIRM|nr:carbon-nitrogen hydrolase family protein [Alkaliphilus peptidifermentans]SCY01644.1 Predicted amidohydrolase [Alkaliphilus peptidifermentans DSM 18978]